MFSSTLLICGPRNPVGLNLLQRKQQYAYLLLRVCITFDKNKKVATHKYNAICPIV